MKRVLWVLGGVFLVATLGLMLSKRTQFLVGGALINAGFGMQDRLHNYDLKHHSVTPAQVWTEFKSQNDMAAKVRETFPRSTEHPLIALLVCMDARIDTSELAGDTRRYYYVVRTAGSVIEAEEQEMLELAVLSGVKVVVLTRHSDCVAEAVAADPAKRAQFPNIAAGVDQRAAHVEAFLKRPVIAERVAKGELLIKEMFVETGTDRLVDKL